MRTIKLQHLLVPSVVSSHLSQILFVSLKRKANFRTHCHNNTEFQTHVLLYWTSYQILISFLFVLTSFSSDHYVVPPFYSFCLVSEVLTVSYCCFWLSTCVLWCQSPWQDRQRIRARQDHLFLWVPFPSRTEHLVSWGKEPGARKKAAALTPCKQSMLQNLMKNREAKGGVGRTEWVLAATWACNPCHLWTEWWASCGLGTLLHPC